MLHTFHLLLCETPFGRILSNVTVVGCIGVLCCCKLSCHGSTITREDNTVLRYDNRSLHGTAIIIVSYVACNSLSVHVALIVTVIYAATVLINRETLGLCKAIAAVMAG